MRALVLRGPRDIVDTGLPDPIPARDEVLIQVEACGVCGSDVHGYLGLSPRRSAHMPLVMGHEMVGRIAGRGADVPDALPTGRRVVIQPQSWCGRCRACQDGMPNICQNMSIAGIERNGGFAEFLTVPADRAFPAPDTLNADAGALVEPLSVQVHCFRTLVPAMPHTVLVLGAGAQGLLAAQLARLAGARHIMVADPVPERLEVAGAVGATEVAQSGEADVVAWVRERTDGWGADAVIEASGSSSARQTAVAAAAPGGTVVLVGLGHGETSLDCLDIVNREISVRGSYCYSDADFLRALDLLGTGQVRTEAMVQSLPLSGGEACFRELVERPSAVPRFLLTP